MISHGTWAAIVTANVYFAVDKNEIGWVWLALATASMVADVVVGTR